MPITFKGFKPKTNRISVDLDRLAKSALPTLKKGFRRYMIHLNSVIKRDYLSGQALKVRSSHLRGGMRAVMSSSGLTGKIVSGMKYGRIHEYGGTILPKKAKYLTVPFPGVKGLARDYDNTFVAKKIIIQRVSRDKIRPLFVLKKSVTIPKRPYAKPAWDKTGDDRRRFIIEPLNDAVGGRA